MKIFISGPNGFMGYNLQTYIPVHEYVNQSKEWVDEFGNYCTDISNLDALSNTIENNIPDLVINAAIRKGSDYCDQDVEDAYRSNIVGMKNIITVCNRFKVPLLHIGTTSYYYSNESLNPIIEESLRTPRTFYGASKLFQESLLVGLAKVPYMIIEPVFLYGNIDDHASGRVDSIPDILVKLVRGDINSYEALIDYRYIKDYTHVSDFIKIMRDIINNPKWGERILVGAGYNKSLEDVGSDIIKLCGDKIKFLGDMDYKKNQIHSYNKLKSFYPNWNSWPKIYLVDYFKEHIYGKTI